MVKSLAWIGLGMVLSAAACAAEPKGTRPGHWAQPVEVKGVPNLFRVDDTLYRSGQPTAEGMRGLKQLGVATILNLRAFHSDRDEIGDTGLACESIPMMAWLPDRKEAVRFLRLVTDPKRAPVLVHCWHGSDRTGAMVAIYRVAVQGWSKDEAIREMTEGGFGFHQIWVNLPKWIRELDIEAVARDAGIPRPAVRPPGGVAPEPAAGRADSK